MGCAYKYTHISAATHPRILNFVPNKFLHIALLLAGRIFKLSNIHHIMNFNENIINERKNVDKLKGVLTKLPISQLLTILEYQWGYYINA